MNKKFLYCKTGAKTVKVKYTNGVLQPLEKLEFAEGTEVTIAFVSPVEDESQDKWENLAISNFAKDWDNEEDACYDNWKEHYHV